MKKTKLIFFAVSFLTCSATSYANSIAPQSVEAFVTAAQKDKIVNVSPNSKGLDVVIVDSTNVMDAKLSESLPIYDQAIFGTPRNYQIQMITKVKRWTEENKTRLKDASKNVAKAVTYQITEVPAIVINQQYVVYGDTVSSAVNKWREAVKNGEIK
ncbi:hypothetical protein C9J21_18420 [Photobacterium phosphoreum]|uniref:DUF1525 domain-containing protein n=1 Tax=Photobacterium phosphoreum TaxID=659 RepID=UPI000D177DDC|nr:DUF1525 domain-containing protein [Photobacterium phosphoreum]PSW30780.1 hypothetical protein C9J21_18420 [Photobacterium phosphoreum]